MSEKELPGEATIVEAFQDGTLAEMVFTNFGYLSSEHLEPIVALCANLHNTDRIDLLSLTQADLLDTIGSTNFFVGQHFFCKVIPHLTGPAESLMEAVESLVIKGGRDFASNAPNAAFREWCAVDVDRSRHIIERAKEGHPLATKLVTFAFEAGRLMKEALALLDDPSQEVRLSAITALGRMDLENDEAARVVLQGLEGVLGGELDDLLASNILVATVSIVSKRSVAIVQEATRVVQRVISRGGPTVLEGCAYALRAHGKGLPRRVIDLILEALLTVDPSDDALVRQLDHALWTLLDSDHRDRAVEFLSQFLPASASSLDSSSFEHSGSHLKRESKDRLWRTLIKWLLSGERVLCEWTPSLLEGTPGHDKPQKIPADCLPLTATERVFLARKAIGYLFQKPVCCASILLALLRISEEETTESIAELLYDPMLVNYGGDLREYLESLPTDDDAQPAVERALARADGFLADLQPPDAIKELHPSEHERQIHLQLTSDQMSAAFRKVQANSVLLNLVSRSVVLYGRRSVAYLQVPGASRRAVEVDLHPHSVSIEMPRQQLLDPVGLDFMLRVYRAERLTR